MAKRKTSAKRKAGKASRRKAIPRKGRLASKKSKDSKVRKLIRLAKLRKVKRKKRK
ncbi:hypothetical protein J4479_02970 [Candidatus Woesearchaeota archaeon]|nr:hypothetical protein [Candidatus Woesearchaeota archaeon]